MSFFKSLLSTGLSRVILDVIKTDSKITVVLTPKSQSSQSGADLIKPLVISYDSVEEMDEKFFLMITAPMAKTKAFFNNLEEYDKALEEAAKEAAAKKAAAKPATAKAEAEKKKAEEKAKAPELNFEIPEDLAKEKTDKILNDAEAVISEAKELQSEKVEEVQVEESEPEVEDIKETPEEQTIEEAVVTEEVVVETPKPKMPSLFS